MTGEKNEILGASALEVIRIIVISNPNIKNLNFKSYFTAKHFFEEDDSGKKSVDRMLKENPPEIELQMRMDRVTILSEDFSSLIENNASGGRCVAVISRVSCSNTKGIFHIPMMDFGCEIRPENQAMIEEFMKKAGYKGFVLVSGASYHFYGINLLSEKEWTKFLGRMILFTEYVDVRYIGHRLNQGFCALRITKNQKQGSIVPKIVSVVD